MRCSWTLERSLSAGAERPTLPADWESKAKVEKVD